jgi:hypothetical protein
MALLPAGYAAAIEGVLHRYRLNPGYRDGAGVRIATNPNRKIAQANGAGFLRPIMYLQPCLAKSDLADNNRETN